MSKGSAVAKTVDFETLPMPAVAGDDHVGRGSEQVGIDDITIPRIEIIQDLSPQRKKNDPKYIPGAEEGLLFNTVSNKLYGSKIYVVPVFWRKEYILWRDRELGGGFGGAFPTMEDAEKALAAKEKPEEFQIHDTAQNFVLVVDPTPNADGSFKVEEAVISMAKSKMTASRKWNSLVRMAGGDRFSRMYRLDTVVASGRKGEYFNWQVTQLGITPESLFARAEAMYEAVVAGHRDVVRDEAVIEA